MQLKNGEKPLEQLTLKMLMKIQSEKILQTVFKKMLYMDLIVMITLKKKLPFSF